MRFIFIENQNLLYFDDVPDVSHLINSRARITIFLKCTILTIKLLPLAIPLGYMVDHNWTENLEGPKKITGPKDLDLKILFRHESLGAFFPESVEN